MPNIEYTLTLNDMMSAKLKGIESNLDSLEKKLSKLSGGKFGGELKTASIAAGTAFGMTAFSFIEKGAKLLVDFGKDVIEKGKTQSLNRSDINLLARGAGPQLFKELQAYAGNSLFGPKVFENAKQMLGFGFAPKDIMPTIKALGDISGGNEEKMGRLTYALSELNAGDITKRHLRQLMQSGLPSADLAKEMHMTNKELLKAFHDQTITGDKIKDAVIKLANDPESRFYNRMKQLMSTPAGKLQQLLTNVDLFKASLGEKALGTTGFANLFNTIDRLFNKSPEFMDKLVQVFSDVFDLLNRMMLKLETFVNSGGLDKLIASLGYIVNNFEDLAILFGGIAGLSSVAGGAGIGAVSGFLLPVTLAGITTEAINLLGTSFGWFGRKNDGNKSLWDLLETSDWSITPEGLLQRGVNVNGKSVSNPSSEYDQNYNLLLKAKKDYGGIDNIRWDPNKSGFPMPMDQYLEEQKRFNENFVGKDLFPGLPMFGKTYGLRQQFAIPGKGVNGVGTPVTTPDASTNVHGMRNTQIYVTINGGFGNFTVETANAQTFLEPANKAYLRNAITDLLIESLADAENTVASKNN